MNGLLRVYARAGVPTSENVARTAHQRRAVRGNEAVCGALRERRVSRSSRQELYVQVSKRHGGMLLPPATQAISAGGATLVVRWPE